MPWILLLGYLCARGVERDPPALAAGPVRRSVPLAQLGVDQLVEPADLALDRVESVLLQLQRVAVELLPGAGQPGPQAVAALLDPAPPALQDPQPDLGVGLGEEREVDAEALVVVRRRAGLGEQFGEPLLAVRGELVDDLGPLAGQRRHGGVRGWIPFGDPAPLAHPPQRRVERAVGERAERAQHGL